MADKAQAYNSFWSSFGLPAYDQYSVPTDATLPYITYEYSEAGFDENNLLTASLWYRSTSWADITGKAKSIFDYIGMGGVLLPFDGGALWIKRGNPFYNRMDDPEDFMIRRIVINIEIESLQ